MSKIINFSKLLMILICAGFAALLAPKLVAICEATTSKQTLPESKIELKEIQKISRTGYPDIVTGIVDLPEGSYRLFISPSVHAIKLP